MQYLKVAGNPEFSRSTNLQSKLIEFFVLVNFYHPVHFGSLEPFTVRKIGDLPHFLLALASKYQFIIKLVKMWSELLNCNGVNPRGTVWSGSGSALFGRLALEMYAEILTRGEFSC